MRWPASDKNEWMVPWALQKEREKETGFLEQGPLYKGWSHLPPKEKARREATETVGTVGTIRWQPASPKAISPRLAYIGDGKEDDLSG